MQSHVVTHQLELCNSSRGEFINSKACNRQIIISMISEIDVEL